MGAYLNGRTLYIEWVWTSWHALTSTQGSPWVPKISSSPRYPGWTIVVRCIGKFSFYKCHLGIIAAVARLLNLGVPRGSGQRLQFEPHLSRWIIKDHQGEILTTTIRKMEQNERKSKVIRNLLGSILIEYDTHKDTFDNPCAV